MARCHRRQRRQRHDARVHPGAYRFLLDRPAGVVASTQAGAPTASVGDTLATQLPDSMFAAMMAKANVAVMTKAIEAYEAAMKDFAATH